MPLGPLVGVEGDLGDLPVGDGVAVGVDGRRGEHEADDPDCDPVGDGEVAEVTLDPDERAKGHGSRLLQAAVDTLAADRFTRAVTWVNAEDDALRRFFTDAGWAPDTAHRELDLDGTGSTTVKQVRLHAAIG